MPNIAGGNPASLGKFSITVITITGAADNGSGLVRITSVAHGFVTGDIVVNRGIVGTTEANGRFTVTKITNDTYDLQGSTFANAYVSDGTASLLVKLTLNFSDMEAIDNRLTNRVAVKSIAVQALTSNTGLIFIGKQQMNMENGDDVLFELDPGVAYSLNMDDVPNAFNILDFRLDASVDGEAAYVSFTRQ